MHALSLLTSFQCLGDRCADNCCNSWAVKIDAPTLAKWQAQAPELLALATDHPSAGKVIAMTGAGGCCPKLEQGLCTIHRDYGEAFLTDACALYPRITRRLGTHTLQSATLSCPEIARLAFFEEAPITFAEAAAGRTPSTLKNYLPEGMGEEEALAYVRAIVRVAGEAAMPAEQVINHMLAFAHAHQNAPLAQWPKLEAPALPEAEPHQNDAMYLLILLTALLQSTGVAPSARLLQVVRVIERMLALTIDWSQAGINVSDRTQKRLREVRHFWQQECAEYLNPLLLRVVQMQYATTLYPFAGAGENPLERATWIAVTFHTMRLALQCVCQAVGGLPTEEEAILAVQPLARIFDHVGDFALIKPVLEEAGWLTLPRALGLSHIEA